MLNASKKLFFATFFLLCGLLLPFNGSGGAGKKVCDAEKVLISSCPSISAADQESFETPTLTISVFVNAPVPNKLRTGLCSSLSSDIFSTSVTHRIVYSSDDFVQLNQNLFLVYRQLLI